MKDLKIIKPDKTRIFHSPLYPNLVRTGTIGDGSCFFHTLCFSLFMEYRKMDIQERRIYIHNLRNEIAKKMSVDRWKQLGDGEMYRMQFILALRPIIQHHTQATDALVYDFRYWDDVILAKLSNEWKSTDLTDCLTIIFPDSNIRPTIITQILADTERQAYAMFQRHLAVNWADEFFMEFVSEIFKCNFYFINATDRLVYRMFKTETTYDRNVVFCWVEETHYECIGELLKGNRVKRVFSNDDALIKRL